MKGRKVAVKRAGISFAEALTLLFIGLRLSGVIQWSWLWVLSPLWITYALIAALALLIAALS